MEIKREMVKEGLGGPSPTNNLARLASEMPLWLGEATCGFLKTRKAGDSFEGEGFALSLA